MIPIFMLDHGADPNYGGFGAMGPLYWAVFYGQSLEVNMKMVEVGGVVRPILVDEAVSKQRVEIVRYLISQYRWEDRGERLEKWLEGAVKTHNYEIISLVESFMKGKRGSKRKERERQRKDGEKKAWAKAKALANVWVEQTADMSTRWWQIWKFAASEASTAPMVLIATCSQCFCALRARIRC